MGGGGLGLEVVLSVSGQMAYLGEGRVFLGTRSRGKLYRLTLK